MAAELGGQDHRWKYLEGVMRAEGLEHQVMNICARLALDAWGVILREIVARGERSVAAPLRSVGQAALAGRSEGGR